MNRINLKSRAPAGGPISLLGLAAITLPALLTYFGYASSFTLGTVVVAIFCLGVAHLILYRRVFLNPTLLFISFVSIVLVLQVLSISLIDDIDLFRAILSLLILTIFFIGAASFASLLLSSSDAQINSFLRRAVIVLLLIGIFGGLGVLQPLSMNYSKSVFPYAEPSLYALALIPVLAAACSVSAIRTRYIYIGSALVILFLLKNLTLAIGIVLVAFLVLPLYQFLLGLVLLLPVLVFMDLSYYTERLEFFEGTSTNLSALVYLQGWQVMLDSFVKSYGFGIGYQQAGINTSEVEAGHLIQAIAGDNLNLKDGGFVFSKLVSELGFLSLFFLFPYVKNVIYSLKIVKLNKEFPKLNQGPLLLLASCSVLCYSIELFVRGAGYFTPSSFLMLVGIFILGSNKNNL
jgi:hypothetical protein